MNKASTEGADMQNWRLPRGALMSGSCRADGESGGNLSRLDPNERIIKDDAG